jgi:hypothetical protein
MKIAREEENSIQFQNPRKGCVQLNVRVGIGSAFGSDFVGFSLLSRSEIVKKILVAR